MVDGIRAQVKTHATAAIGEMIGTAMFLFIAEGAAKTANLSRTAAQTQTNAPLDSQTIMMIATSFGLSLLFTAWIFYRITGGLFNPAITVALYFVGVLTATRATLLFISQILGGIIASALVLALTPKGSGDIDVVNTALSGGITYAQGFFLEMLTTSILVFSVLMLAVEKHRATFLAPVGIGLTLFACHIFTVAWTGTGMNPARSFGPAVVGGRFPEHHEIYWIAPLLGGLLSVIYFEILKAAEYNSAVLDQDSDKEVTGLRPVHMRVYKRLAGHHDWEAETERKPSQRRLLRLRLRRAQADLDEHNNYRAGAGQGYTSDGDATDAESIATNLDSPPPRKPNGLPMPVTTPSPRVRAVDTFHGSANGEKSP